MFFFFNDTATTEIYTLSLHDALPISWVPNGRTLMADTQTSELRFAGPQADACGTVAGLAPDKFYKRDRKSTRLNSSHLGISYAVFCLKKKKYLARSSHQRAKCSPQCG